MVGLPEKVVSEQRLEVKEPGMQMSEGKEFQAGECAESVGGMASRLPWPE